MEELEFKICEYLDGSLSAPDRAAVNAILESNSEARDLLETHRRLDAAIRMLPPVPNIRWELQAAQISAAIVESENLEFAISQYVDGTLDGAARQTVETRLAVDSEARSLRTHHDQLTAALRSMQPGSEIHWATLTDRISASIDRHQSQGAQSFKIFQWRTVMPLAAAASLLIAVGIAVSVYLRSPAVRSVKTTPGVTAIARVIEVSGPAAQVGSDPLADVQIGPSHTISAAVMASRYDDVVSRPARVIIASSAKTDSDLTELPY